ncbi:MAG: hypothetical protein FWC36_00410 [Spirochaetes bacterium]|nr:hypothetical protein [Spirochaetota bacterium]
MNSGIGLSQIFLVLVLIVIFADAKQIPGFVRKSLKIYRQLRAELRNIFDNIK